MARRSDSPPDERAALVRHPAPPISGAVPAFTGGIHAFQTEDNLRHRHASAAPVAARWPRSPRRRQNAVALDDADVAAGSLLRQTETRHHRSLTQPCVYPSTPKATRAETLIRPSSDNVHFRKRSLRARRFDEWRLPPPCLQTMDRGLVDAETESTSSPYHPSIRSSPQQSSVSPRPQSQFVVFGWDMTTYTRRSQFLISAGGTFTFSLLYGYLQELLAVELCHRKLGLFLAAVQFGMYAVLSYFFRNLEKSSSSQETTKALSSVPMEMYLGLSILRAIDLGMTNLAMQYVNYPAKTLMKSTRILFTMLFGVLVTKKRYGLVDYGIVGLMVAGLGIFMHADSKTSAVFQPLGVIMLTISLLCDGAISNVSESIMNRYKVGQDEFIFRLYSVALFFVSIAAAFKGDLRDGFLFVAQPGTLREIEEDLDPTWSITAKFLILLLFSTSGYLSSSCSAAITKSFGALTMSITSTARKATTIFLSFALFPKECTWEHISGIVLFIGSLIGKSMRASRHTGHHSRHQASYEYTKTHLEMDNNSPIKNRTMSGLIRRKLVEDVV